MLAATWALYWVLEANGRLGNDGMDGMDGMDGHEILSQDDIDM